MRVSSYQTAAQEKLNQKLKIEQKQLIDLQKKTSGKMMLKKLHEIIVATLEAEKDALVAQFETEKNTLVEE